MSVFLSDNDLTQAVADYLSLDVTVLASRWAEIITNANRSAYWDIRGKLLERGFTAAQIDAWDRGPEFARDIGLFYCLVRGVGAQAYDDRWAAKLDRRKDLETVMVEVAGGAIQNPTGTPPPVGHGSVETSRHELHRLRQYGGEGGPIGGYLYGNLDTGMWHG